MGCSKKVQNVKLLKREGRQEKGQAENLLVLTDSVAQDHWIAESAEKE